ncbi:MAG: hypothetical protein WC560_07260 [Syntrophales bacterium]
MIQRPWCVKSSMLSICFAVIILSAVFLVKKIFGIGKRTTAIEKEVQIS